MPKGQGYDVIIARGANRGTVIDTFDDEDIAKAEMRRLLRLNRGRAVVLDVVRSSRPARQSAKPPRRRTDAKMDRLNRLERALTRLEFASRHKQPLDIATLGEIKKERDRVRNVFERVKEGKPIDPGRLRRGFRDRLTGIRSSLKTDRMEVKGSEATVDALDDAIKEIEEAL